MTGIPVARLAAKATIRPANNKTAAHATRRSEGRSATAIPVASSSATATRNATPIRGSLRKCSGTSLA